MASQVTRRQMERWLLDHGFTPKVGKKTSHRQFHGHDVTVTLPGHGAPDLTKKHVGMLLRQLEAAGFARTALLDDLKG